MKKFSIAIAVTSCLIPIAHAKESAGSCKEASTRAVAFLRNAHAGKAMIDREWLTDDARQSPTFSGFGGVDALVRQSTARAERFGGLRAVNVLKARPLKLGCEISAEVKFLKNHKDLSNPAVAASEEIIWTFQMIELNGHWKIAG